AAESDRDDAADDWYERGCELETQAPVDARAAYVRAVEIDPGHAAAHVNLGRLLHEAGEIDAAERHYRSALAAQPADATAAFNLGVALEDVGGADQAITAYEQVVASDPGYADAYYNLGRLCESLGRRAEAIRHLRTYRKLTRGH